MKNKAFECAIASALRHRDRLHQQQSDAYFAIGQIARKIDGDPGKYGSASIARMAQRLEMKKTTVYDCLSVARAFRSAKFKKITSTGVILWSHAVILASIDLPSNRAKLVAVCLSEKLTVRELRRRVAELQQKQRANGVAPAATAEPDPVAEPFEAHVERTVSLLKGCTEEISTWKDDMFAYLRPTDRVQLLSELHAHARAVEAYIFRLDKPVPSAAE